MGLSLLFFDQYSGWLKLTSSVVFHLLILLKNLTQLHIARSTLHAASAGHVARATTTKSLSRVARPRSSRLSRCLPHSLQTLHREYMFVLENKNDVVFENIVYLDYIPQHLALFQRGGGGDLNYLLTVMIGGNHLD